MCATESVRVILLPTSLFILVFTFTAVTCPPVPAPTKALASTTTALYGTLVEYSCIKGYFSLRHITVDNVTTSTNNITFRKTIECMETGQWNDTAFVCQSKPPFSSFYNCRFIIPATRMGLGSDQLIIRG